MHTDYKIALLRELRDQQVRFAPRLKRLEQAERAEKLLNELEGRREYPYEFLFYRVTEHRPDESPRQLISGNDAAHDLRLFVEDITDSLNLRIEEAPERVHTVEELSKMFNVSTKTISRWRDQGLVSRRYVAEGRKRVAFLQSSVERFGSRNRERVKRGEQFSQLTNDEKAKIIERARELAANGLTLSGVARQVSEESGRSIETIRYTIKNFDRENMAMAIFPDHRPVLSDDDRVAIFHQHRRGASITVLARRYGRTVSTINRLLCEQRAIRILELPLDFIPNPEFEKKSAEKEILAEMADTGSTTRKMRAPAGLPPYLCSLYDVPLLTREQEYHLFRKMNYLKFRASKLREQLDMAAPKVALMEEIEQLSEKAVAVKNRLVQCNLRLVVSIAKRHVGSSDDFFSLISDGNMSLIRAVEKFDYSRGNKFSTYASWAIMKNFARSIPDEFRHKDRFRTTGEELFLSREDQRSDRVAEESAQQTRQDQINRILHKLDEREQQIIIRRFGLDHSHEPLTLKEVGASLGVTKERIRQLEARALSKLRAAADAEKIDLPE